MRVLNFLIILFGVILFVIGSLFVMVQINTMQVAQEYDCDNPNFTPKRIDYKLSYTLITCDENKTLVVSTFPKNVDGDNNIGWTSTYVNA